VGAKLILVGGGVAGRGGLGGFVIGVKGVVFHRQIPSNLLVNGKICVDFWKELCVFGREYIWKLHREYVCVPCDVLSMYVRVLPIHVLIVGREAIFLFPGLWLCNEAEGKCAGLP